MSTAVTRFAGRLEPMAWVDLVLDAMGRRWAMSGARRTFDVFELMSERSNLVGQRSTEPEHAHGERVGIRHTHRRRWWRWR